MVVPVVMSCQKAFEYDAQPPLMRLLPAEVYDVEIVQTPNPIGLAENYFRQQAYVQSAAYFVSALQSDPLNHKALLGAGSSYSMLGQFKQADV